MTANESMNPSGASAGVEFKSVSKKYEMSKGNAFLAVEDFNLTISDGEFFCLLGPSGCGKTTMMNILAGFESPTRGEVVVNGESIEAPSRERGVVFQGDQSLLPWASALKNVAFGLRLRKIAKKERLKTAQEFLELVDLKGQEDKRPPELSGGMRQRVQLARVWANDPDLLCMDEPFAALDAQTRKRLQEELTRIWLAHKKTVLFITHDILESVLLADRVGVMTPGPSSRLREVITIDVERPRSRTDSRVIQYYERVSQLID